LRSDGGILNRQAERIRRGLKEGFPLSDLDDFLGAIDADPADDALRIVLEVGPCRIKAHVVAVHFF